MEGDRLKRLITKILSMPAHSDLRLPKAVIGDPVKLGFSRSIGIPRGQIADYRLKLKDGRSIHLREYIDHYLAHWDRRDPLYDPLGHILVDAPYWIPIGAFISWLAFIGISALA